MRLPILLCVVTILVHAVLSASVDSPKLPPGCDDGVIINGTFHKNEVLAQGLNRPYQLSYHEQKHEIFFSNNVGSDKEDKFEIKRLLLHNGTEEIIKEVENGFATAICDEKKFAYFGGSSGIYKMHLESGKIDKIINNYDVWDLFFKKHLYFIEYFSQKLYKVKHPKTNHSEKNYTYEVEHEKWVHEEIYQFAIDGDDDKFITNKTGLFMIRNGTQHRIKISGGVSVFRAIEINHKGQAFFVGSNGIYVVRKPEHTLHLIAHISNTFGLTFDNDDVMIYSNPLKIIKLSPSSECKAADVISKAALSGPIIK